MAVNQKTPSKELLQRGNIRTMKKDLKKLREADTQKESDKIITFKENPKPIIEPKDVIRPVHVPIIEEPAPVTLAPESMEKPAPLAKPIATPPTPAINAQELKQNASENEKQKMFLLQSKKTELEKQLEIIAKEKTPIAAEKNRLLDEQKSWQEKLAPLEQKEATAPDALRESIEKERLPLDQALADVEKKIRALSENERTLSQKEEAIKMQIHEIDISLDEISFALAKKEAQKNMPAMQNGADTKPITPKPLPTLMPKIQPEKQYQKEMPAPLKEKIAETSKIEDEKRRKFMEDVEQWAALHEHTNTNNQHE